MTDLEQRASLLPCPFCGGEASFEQVGGGPMREGFAWSVGCINEDCHGFQALATYARKVEAATAWNTRASTHTGIEEAARLRTALVAAEDELRQQAHGGGSVRSADKALRIVCAALLPQEREARSGDPESLAARFRKQFFGRRPGSHLTKADFAMLNEVADILPQERETRG